MERHGPWQPVEAADGVTDSARERFLIRIPDFPVGERVVVIRVFDIASNAGLAKVIIRLKRAFLKCFTAIHATIRRIPRAAMLRPTVRLRRPRGFQARRGSSVGAAEFEDAVAVASWRSEYRSQAAWSSACAFKRKAEFPRRQGGYAGVRVGLRLHRNAGPLNLVRAIRFAQTAIESSKRRWPACARSQASSNQKTQSGFGAEHRQRGGDSVRILQHQYCVVQKLVDSVRLLRAG